MFKQKSVHNMDKCRPLADFYRSITASAAIVCNAGCRGCLPPPPVPNLRQPTACNRTQLPVFEESSTAVDHTHTHTPTVPSTFTHQTTSNSKCSSGSRIEPSRPFTTINIMSAEPELVVNGRANGGASSSGGDGDGGSGGGGDVPEIELIIKVSRIPDRIWKTCCEHVARRGSHSWRWLVFNSQTKTKRNARTVGRVGGRRFDGAACSTKNV